MRNYITMNDIYKYQAEVCKTLANAKRLEIIHALKGGEKSVGELVEILGVAKANVSQHLALLKSCGIIKSRREGTSVYYSIANKKIIEACSIMNEVVKSILEDKKRLLETLKKAE